MSREHDPEDDQGLADPDAWGPVADSLPSIGDYLTKQRQLRGISRQELCDLTRIPMRSLERLESGAFDELDDGFVRGFVRTVAAALGLDPDDTLAQMSREPAPRQGTARTIAATGMMRAGVLVAAVALLLISVGLISVAMRYVPGQAETSPLVMRRDPVRRLAEARGVLAANANQALVPRTPVPSETATLPLERPLAGDETQRAEVRAAEH